MPPELTGPQITVIILGVLVAMGLALAWAFKDEEISSSIRESTYKQARKIIAKRMEEGTQLTISLLEDSGWVYRDGYWLDPRVIHDRRVSIKFLAGARFDKIHYYCVYRCVHLKDEETDTETLTLVARESSVEWLETYLLTINKKPEKLI